MEAYGHEMRISFTVRPVGELRVVTKRESAHYLRETIAKLYDSDVHVFCENRNFKGGLGLGE